jgi:two-component sensor histidine kinase
MGVVSSSFLLLLFLGEITGLYRKLADALRELTISNLRLEQRVAERTQDLRNALTTKDKTLAERDVLLREVYHRVKNNLQVIDTLVMLQASLLPDEWAEKVLQLRPRVKALGLVHQQLMESKDLATFSAMGFLDDLCRSLATAFAASDCGITLRVEAEPVPVDLDVAIPLGLLVTEMVSNAFKHAFPDHQGGEIVVCFSCQPPRMARLVVADTGCGISEMVPDGTVGSQIIEALVTQIEGEKLVRVMNGTSVEITFPYPRGSLNDG